MREIRFGGALVLVFLCFGLRRALVEAENVVELIQGTTYLVTGAASHCSNSRLDVASGSVHHGLEGGRVVLSRHYGCVEGYGSGCKEGVEFGFKNCVGVGSCN